MDGYPNKRIVALEHGTNRIQQQSHYEYNQYSCPGAWGRIEIERSRALVETERSLDSVSVEKHGMEWFDI